MRPVANTCYSWVFCRFVGLKASGESGHVCMYSACMRVYVCVCVYLQIKDGYMCLLSYTHTHTTSSFKLAKIAYAHCFEKYRKYHRLLGNLHGVPRTSLLLDIGCLAEDTCRACSEPRNSASGSWDEALLIHMCILLHFRICKPICSQEASRLCAEPCLSQSAPASSSWKRPALSKSPQQCSGQP